PGDHVEPLAVVRDDGQPLHARPPLMSMRLWRWPVGSPARTAIGSPPYASGSIGNSGAPSSVVRTPRASLTTTAAPAMSHRQVRWYWAEARPPAGPLPNR